jgi:hypothetical protein
MKSCDIYPNIQISSIRHVYEYDWSSLSSNKSVYINTSAVPDFVVRCFPKIPLTTRFTLVTGDADETLPYDIFRSTEEFINFIEDPRIIHWFSQNCMIDHPKLTHMPIGMDYHTLARTHHWWGPMTTPKQQEDLLIAIHKKSPSSRNNILYCNFHFQMNTTHAYDRREALSQVPSSLLMIEVEKQLRMKSWMTQTKYTFVASPYGGGYDCHRTWEALALGCIPVVKSSKLDRLFIDNNLPVLIVNKWSDITAKMLEEAASKYKVNPIEMNALTLKYWTDKIKNTLK